MAKSRNNKITRRGNHNQRVRSHDEYLIKAFPGFSNMTNPYSAVVAELLEEEMAEFQPNEETIEAMKEAEAGNLTRFNTSEELFEDLNSNIKVLEGDVIEGAKLKGRLEAEGWTVGSTQSFLGLSDEDMASIDTKLALADVIEGGQELLTNGTLGSSPQEEPNITPVGFVPTVME